MLPCYYKVVRINTIGKVASVQQATFQEDERGLLHVLGEMGRLSVMMNGTFNCGSKPLKVVRSTPHRSIGLNAKKGGFGWDSRSDPVKVEKGSERRGETDLGKSRKSRQTRIIERYTM